MIRLFALLVLLAATPAQAGLTLCNRTSYVLDAALGLEKFANVATRGWFHIIPGQCRSVMEDNPGGELVYVYAKTPALYGAAPLPQSGHANLCVGGAADFTIGNARSCSGDQRQVQFTAVKPSETEKGLIANLAEEADYNDEQARLAGIQRLLVIAGYDANPIDGLPGNKTTAALAQFVKDRQLPANASADDKIFDQLMTAAQSPEGAGFSWCNETSLTVMASLGIVEMGAIVTRGWYRIEPGKCVRPEVRGEPRKLYTYAEAVDANGFLVKRGEQALAWGGDIPLCTREGKFELSDHKDCAARGLMSAPFAAVEVAGRASTTVRFKEP